MRKTFQIILHDRPYNIYYILRMSTLMLCSRGPENFRPITTLCELNNNFNFNRPFGSNIWGTLLRMLGSPILGSGESGILSSQR